MLVTHDTLQERLLILTSNLYNCNFALHCCCVALFTHFSTHDISTVFHISLLVTFLCHTHTHTHTAFLFITAVSSQQQRIFSFFLTPYWKLHVHTDRTNFQQLGEREFSSSFSHTLLRLLVLSYVIPTQVHVASYVVVVVVVIVGKAKWAKKKKSEAIPIWYGRFFFIIGKFTLNTFLARYLSKFICIHLYFSSSFTFLQTPALYEKLFESFHQGISKFSFTWLFTCNCAILTIYDNC